MLPLDTGKKYVADLVKKYSGYDKIQTRFMWGLNPSTAAVQAFGDRYEMLAFAFYKAPTFTEGGSASHLTPADMKKALHENEGRDMTVWDLVIENT